MGKLHAFDTETHPIQPGLLAPPLVCGSIATAEAGSERLLSKADALGSLRGILERDEELGGVNLVYDLGVCAAADPTLVPLIFRALRFCRVYDASILERMHDNARGCLERDPITGAPFYYGLAALESRYLGIDRSAEKDDPNSWRMRYHELEQLPITQWPDAAIQYPRQDARGTMDVLRHQLEDKGRYNIACQHADVAADWALHLISMWGMRTDPALVAVTAEGIERKHRESRERFCRVGITRVRPCNKKAGVYERSDPEITPEWLAELSQGLSEEIPPEVQEARLEDINRCVRALEKDDPARPLRYATDKGYLQQLVTAAYRDNPPMTPGGESGADPQVSTSGDTLAESGDALLEDFAEAGANETLNATFLSVIRQGTEVPVNARYSVMVASDRTSCWEPNLQQLPRKGGIRECFIARPGTVYVSVDYNGIELCALGQICIWRYGHSAIADAINSGQDLHTRLAARVLGLSYDDAMARKKAEDPIVLDLRQVMKQVNFGLPGLMGAHKLVLTARGDGVKMCELAHVSVRCADNERLTDLRDGQGNLRAPVCCECYRLACQYKDLYFEEWPEVAEYHAETPELARQCAQGIPVKSMSRGHMLRLDTSAGAISNHFFQNLAAVGAKRALVALSEEAHCDRKSVLYGRFHPVVYVHDEVIGEADETLVHEIGWRQAEIMIAEQQSEIPDVKVTAKPAACRRWFKGADYVTDKAGRMRPWWPKDWAWGPDQEQKAKDEAA